VKESRLLSFDKNIQTRSFAYTQLFQKKMATHEEMESNYTGFIERVLDVEENPRTEFLT